MFSDYNIETNLMYNDIGLSRNILMVRNSIPYNRRTDLEHNLISSIWIEISLKGGKKILLSGAYRQWRLPVELDPSKISNKKQNQMERLDILLNQWTKACSEGKDVFVAIDDNIDCNISNNSPNNKILLSKLNDSIATNNLVRLNTNNTRFVPNNLPSSLDHFYTNVPNKTNDIVTHDYMVTD